MKCFSSLLGPSWLPKLGGILGLIGAGLKTLPATAPGALYMIPYADFIEGIGLGIVGLAARQNNVSSETAGAKPVPEKPAPPTP